MRCPCRYFLPTSASITTFLFWNSITMSEPPKRKKPNSSPFCSLAPTSGAVPLRFAHVLHIGEILFLRILQQFDKMRSLFSGPLNGFSENRNGSVLHLISLFQLFLWPDKSVSAKSFPHQRRLSAALMKDGQRFADKLAYKQLRKE